MPWSGAHTPPGTAALLTPPRVLTHAPRPHHRPHRPIQKKAQTRSSRAKEPATTRPSHVSPTWKGQGAGGGGSARAAVRAGPGLQQQGARTQGPVCAFPARRRTELSAVQQTKPFSPVHTCRAGVGGGQRRAYEDSRAAGACRRPAAALSEVVGGAPSTPASARPAAARLHTGWKASYDRATPRASMEAASSPKRVRTVPKAGARAARAVETASCGGWRRRSVWAFR